MTVLRTRVSRRLPDEVLVVSGPHDLRVADAVACGPVCAPGACVALRVADPLTLVQALIGLDGTAGTLVLLSAALAPGPAVALSRAAAADTILTDQNDLAAEATAAGLDLIEVTGLDDLRRRAAPPVSAARPSDWVLTTSGTSGLPKLVRHRLDGLARTVVTRRADRAPPVWGLTYEATRFAGLQVVLQALLGGGTLVAEPLSVPLGTRLDAFSAAGVTHLSATPTRWRQVVMHPASANLALRQITLGGEIADDDLLDTLGRRFPDSRVTHIYASTEVGVGFSVKDGRAGFPESWLETDIDSPPHGIELRVRDDKLWIRVPGPRTAYLGKAVMDRDADGFVDTQDRVSRSQGRVRFLGRDSGGVNVGGAKIYPETVEQVLNAHPDVALSRVGARRNPFSGNILVADIQPVTAPDDSAAFKTSLIRYCRDELPLEAVPALIRLTDTIAINAAGKVVRDAP